MITMFRTLALAGLIAVAGTTASRAVPYDTLVGTGSDVTIYYNSAETTKPDVLSNNITSGAGSTLTTANQNADSIDLGIVPTGQVITLNLYNGTVNYATGSVHADVIDYSSAAGILEFNNYYNGLHGIAPNDADNLAGLAGGLYPDLVIGFWDNANLPANYYDFTVVVTGAAAAVPEPASILCLGAGLIAIGLMRRRKA